MVEVIIFGEQRYAKAFVAAHISFVFWFFFFGRRLVGILLTTPSCIFAAF